MSKELYFTDGNNEVKYLDTTASFNLAITQDGSAFDLTNATAIDVKVANDTGYVFDKSIDMATIKQPLAGLITMPVDAEVMNALVPDDYTIEVWVTLSSLVTPGSQEGLTDTGSTTNTTSTTTTNTTTYNAIFPSDDPQGFTITENVMSDSGDVIPVMSLDDFQQEFDQLKTDLTNKVSTLQGPKGDTGQGLEIKGKVDTTSQLPATASEGDGYLVGEELYVYTSGAWKDCGPLQGPQGIQGKTGTGVSSTTIQYQIANSATTTPTGTWSNTLIATTQVNPFLWTQVTLNYDDGTSKSFYLVSSKGDKGDKGDTGATGPVGPQGPVGAGLVVKGTVSNASQLPTTGNQEGYCYFVGTDLYVWDAGAWKNCGNVSPDLSKYVTVTDLNNGLSTKVNTTDTSSWQKQKVTADNGLPNIFVNAGAKISDSLKAINQAGFWSFYANGGSSDNPWGEPIKGFTISDSTDGHWSATVGALESSGNYVSIVNDNGTVRFNKGSDDSKVVHTADTSNWQKQKITNDDGGNKYSFTMANTTDLAAAIQALPLGYHTFYCQAGVKGNPSSQAVRGIAEITTAGAYPLGVGYLTDSTGDFWSFYVDISGLKLKNKQDKLTITPADDSKVVHLSGAEEISGQKTFDVAPIDKTTGNPYITKDGVPAVPSTLADTTKLSNFTAGLQSNGTAVATQTDVTTAISTATANMVDSSKPANFTAGLQSGGIDVATAADVSKATNAANAYTDSKVKSSSDTGWQPLVSKDSSSAAFSSDSYYRIINGIMYVHGTISVLNTANVHYQLWDIPTGWSISNKAGTQVIYPEDTTYNNYVQLLAGDGSSNNGGLLVYEDKTGHSTDFRFVTPVDKV